MVDQSDQQAVPAQTSEELRQCMLEQLDASKKAIEELSNEELEEVGGMGSSVASVVGTVFHDKVVQATVAGGAVSVAVTGINKWGFGHQGGGGD